MMRKLPWVLLAISIIFNFTFAGGFLHARSASEVAEAPDTRGEMVANEFHLDSHQQQVFTELRDKARDRIKEMRDAILLTRQELWSALSSDSPDAQKIGDIQDRLADLHRQYRELSSEYFGKFLSVLTDEQRQAVLEKIRERERSRHGNRRLLERFDTDGDGKLSDAERARARESMRRPQQGRPRKPVQHGPREKPGTGIKRPAGSRPSGNPATETSGDLQEWLLKRFDANGDGTLDDAERTRARESLSVLRGPQKPPDWIVRRFDTDGDGKLSSGERAAAVKTLRDKKLIGSGPEQH